MSTTVMRVVLRTAAIMIAIAAAIDPVLSIARPSAAPIALVNLTRGTTDDVRESLRRLTDAAVSERAPVAQRIPCTPQERCVIVADGSVASALPADVREPLLLIADEPEAPNVRVRSAIVASPHAAGASSAQVVLDGARMTGQTTVRVRDGAAIVGAAAHRWTADGVATIDVPWWPIAVGPRALHIEAMSDANETTVSDNAVDVAVEVSNEPLPVLVFDARPSWASTFIRRALEDDPRFVVEHRARVAPSVTAATPAGRLDVRALDAAAVAIIGGPDALTEDETALIDRFARTRGGTVILLPEREPRGASSRLFQTVWREQLTATPQSVGPLRASEILHAVDLPIGSTVVAGHGDRPSVVLIPVGAGAVLVGGAMDAWRFSGNGDGPATFDGFWRSIAATSAVSSRALQVTFDNPPAIPGSRQRFRVTARSMEPTTATEASAIARCGDSPSASAHAVRLWPSGSLTTFTGEIAIARSAKCDVEVAIGPSRATSGIAVAHEPSASAPDTLARLERSVRQAGGTISRRDNLAAANLSRESMTTVRTPIYPMRSVWWIVPFALCLSGEWWMRRRRGLS